MSLESYQVEILEALDGAGPSSIKQTISLVTYSDEFSDVKDDLLEVKELGLIGKYSNGTWHITNKGKQALDHYRNGTEPAPTIQPPKQSSLKVVPTSSERKFPQKHPALVAFDRAAGRKERVIRDLELKISVLDRLSELMADDISDVLQDIKSDLEQE